MLKHILKIWLTPLHNVNRSGNLVTNLFEKGSCQGCLNFELLLVGFLFLWKTFGSSSKKIIRMVLVLLSHINGIEILFLVQFQVT